MALPLSYVSRCSSSFQHQPAGLPPSCASLGVASFIPSSLCTSSSLPSLLSCLHTHKCLPGICFLFLGLIVLFYKTSLARLRKSNTKQALLALRIPLAPPVLPSLEAGNANLQREQLGLWGSPRGLPKVAEPQAGEAALAAPLVCPRSPHSFGLPGAACPMLRPTAFHALLDAGGTGKQAGSVALITHTITSALRHPC